MKRILLSLFCILSAFQLQGQNQFDYAYSFGSEAQVRDKIVNVNDKTYILTRAGGATTSVNADPKNQAGTLNIENGQLAVLYAVIILNADGSSHAAIKTEVQLPYGNVDMEVNSLGEVYLFGDYTDNVWLNPDAPTVATHSESGSNFFFAKYNAAGSFLYSKSTTGGFTPVNRTHHLALINDTDFYLLTELSGIVDMSFQGTTAQNFGATGENRTFLGIYKTDGTLDKGYDFGGEVDFYSVETNSTGELFTFGRMTDGTVDLDPGTATVSLTTSAKARNLLVKYDNDLNYAQHIDFGRGNISSDRFMTIDPNDSVLISGSTAWESLYPDTGRDILDLDPGAGVFDVTSSTARGIFLGKYGADLAFGGGYSFGGEETADVTLSDIQASADKILFNVYLGAGTSTPLNIGGSGPKLLAPGERSVFLSLDRSNSIVGYEAFQGINGSKLLLRTSGDIIHSGYASGTDDLDTGSDSFTLGTNGLYISRLTSCPGSTTVETPSGLCSSGAYTVGNNTYSQDGTYIDFLQDANGCDKLVITNLVFPANGLTATATVVSDINTCNGDNNGSFSLSVTNGVSPYEVSFDGTVFYAVPDNGLFENSPALNNETVLVRDASGCITSTNTLTLTEPAELQILGINATDVSCFGGNDGSLAAAVTGGTQSYVYSLDGVNFQSSPTFSSLEVGSYTYFVKDSNECITSQTTTIGTQATEITAQQTVVDASACGAADGSFTITNTTGGAGNYEYMIPGGNFQASPVFSNLSAGLYQVTIKDANGCTTQIAVPVSEPSGINATVSFVDPLCFESTNGEITINNVSGGSGNYSYSINGTDFQQSNTFTGLGSGSVNAVIKDDQGCITIKTVVLFEPPQLLITATLLSDVSCKDGNDGSATLTANGGTPLYKFSADGIIYGNLTNQPEVLTGLSAGKNTFYVQDLNGCISTTELTINEPAGSTISVDLDAGLACFGDSDAIITIVASSPIAGALEYSLDGSTFGSSGSFSGLAAGDYTAYIKDPNSCVQEFDFTIDQPDLITATFTTTDISCTGSKDGTITVSATGGTGNFTYSIDGTNFQSANSFQNLAAGSYTITIRDDNNCTVTLTETISEPAPLSLAVSSLTHPSCNGGGDGSFSLAGNGGTATYEYSLDGINFQGSDTFTNLGAGTYNFTIRDANGCTASATGQLVDPTVLSSTAAVNNQVSCAGGTDASVTVNASGGNGGYSYSLDAVNFNNTTGTFDALAAGVHTITTKDSRGCTSASMVTITEPLMLIASATVDNNVTCNSGSDGAISGSAAGGTAPYTYSIDGVSFQSTATFSGLSAGMTTFTVKDANDCMAATTVQISEPVSIDLQATVTSLSCHGAGDGSVTLVATNGAGGYEYALDNGGFSSNATFTGLAAGEHTFTVKDANGCTQSITPEVGEPDPLTLNFEAVDITCNGETDGQIAGFTQGGTSPYQYSLDGTNFQNGPFSNLAAGSYTLLVKDSQGCTADKVVMIVEPDLLTVSTTVVSQVSCNGADDGEASITVGGGSVPYSYSLDGTVFNNSLDLTALAPASYTITVRDASGCEATSSFTITEPDPLTMSIETSAVLCNSGSDGSISVNMAGGTAPYTYALDGGTFGSSNKFADLAAGTYSVTVKDSQGCTVTSNTTIDEPGPIVISSTNAVLPLCNGDSNVEISVTASGGTGTLEYSLDGTNYQSSNSFTGLTAGTYNITVRDANSCTATTGANISEPAALVLSTAITYVQCFGENTGEISITASGGTGSLEYSLDGTTFQSATTFTELSAGDYTVTVKDTNGCTKMIAATISEPAVLSVTATVVSNNTINITTAGGVTPYEYSLDATNFQTSSSFNNLANGDYTVTVRDANGCTASTSGSLIVTSLEGAPLLEAIRIYPNPVSDYLTFSKLAAGDRIRLVSLSGNSLGHTLITEEKKAFNLNISNIRQKVFLAIVISKEGRLKLNQKVIKEE